ncbi:MAG TPA: TetR/AcrR family transcriptional regulator [Fontimonas sp.]
MPSILSSHRRLASLSTVLPPGAALEGSRGVILTESLRLFAEHGYGGTSIRDIAKLVGIQAASVYSHFPSKAHVLAELVKLGHEEHHHRMRAAVLEAGAEPQAQLIALVHAHVAAHAEYPMLAVVSNAEMHALPETFAAPILAVRNQSERLLHDVIERGIRLGVFAVPDAQLAMLAIGAMGLRVAHWYSGDFGKTPDQVADIFAEFACRLVGAKR